MAEALKMKEEGARRGGSGEGGGNAITQAFENLGEYPRRWRTFLHEVRVEMRQVTWPTRHEVFVTTWVVIVTVAFFGVFLEVVDKLVQLGVAYILKRFGV